MTKTIDIHTHVLADATIKLMQKEIPSLGLKMTPFDADNAVCEVAGVPYRPFPRGGHDIERRLKDMDATLVDMHLLSVAPQTWLYDQEESVGVAGSQIQNDEIARLVKEMPDRFDGIATLPMQAPEKAADGIAPRHDQARPARRHDRLELPRQESRRPEFRADLGGGGRARRLHDDSSGQCRRR